jgi:hypothetical protein
MAADAAAELRRLAREVRARGAKAAADAAGNKFVELTLPHVPVRSGALRRSIRVHGGGGGIRSTSSSAPHTVYAAIINYGGTIRVKHTYTTKTGKTMPGWLSDGKTFFGHSVKIPGQGYWTLDGKEGAIRGAASQAIQRIIGGG